MHFSLSDYIQLTPVHTLTQVFPISFLPFIIIFFTFLAISFILFYFNFILFLNFT